MENPNVPTLETPNERELKNTINMQKQVIEQKEGDLQRLGGQARDIQVILSWFRDQYSYDTREAAVIDLLRARMGEMVDTVDYSDIPF